MRLSDYQFSRIMKTSHRSTLPTAGTAMDDHHHSIDISEDDGVRYLHFGSEWIQGAMRIRRPWSLELHYTREMMAGLLLHAAPWP